MMKGGKAVQEKKKKEEEDHRPVSRKRAVLLREKNIVFAR